MHITQYSNTSAHTLTSRILPRKRKKTQTVASYLDRLREEDGGDEGDEHRRDPLLALDVTELDAVEGDEGGAESDGQPERHPGDDGHPPGERRRLLLLLQFLQVCGSTR